MEHNGTFLGVGIGILCLCLLNAGSYATDYPGSDHAGSDFIVVNGDTLSGVHSNVGLFRLDELATATISSSLRIEAQTIDIAGTLDATGAGYAGGAGASWGGNSAQPGQGPFGGVPYENSNGGYLATAANGDTTTDTAVYMGSGGAGGSAGWVEMIQKGFGHPGVGGHRGTAGGGQVELVAQGTLNLRTGACLIADAQPKIYTTGINPPSNQGAGAGGGILLMSTLGSTITLETGSRISSQGGDDTTSNGGTLKIFGGPGATIQNNGQITAGRVFIDEGIVIVPPTVDLAIITVSQNTPECKRRNCVYDDLLTISNAGTQTVAKARLELYLSASQTNVTDGKVIKRYKLKNIGSTPQSIPTHVRIANKHQGYLVAVITSVSAPDEIESNNIQSIRVLP